MVDTKRGYRICFRHFQADAFKTGGKRLMLKTGKKVKIKEFIINW